jgi:hypothetical protein
LELGLGSPWALKKELALGSELELALGLGLELGLGLPWVLKKELVLTQVVGVLAEPKRAA